MNRTFPPKLTIGRPLPRTDPNTYAPSKGRLVCKLLIEKAGLILPPLRRKLTCRKRDIVNPVRHDCRGNGVGWPGGVLVGRTRAVGMMLDGRERLKEGGNAQQRTPRPSEWRRRLVDLGDLIFQFGQVGQQFLLVGPADEVEADHLIGSLGWLLAGPQRDQQTRDNRTVRLNFHADRIGAQ
jgi:hypothetical protein